MIVAVYTVLMVKHKFLQAVTHCASHLGNKPTDDCMDTVRYTNYTISFSKVQKVLLEVSFITVI